MVDQLPASPVLVATLGSLPRVKQNPCPTFLLRPRDSFVVHLLGNTALSRQPGCWRSRLRQSAPRRLRAGGRCPPSRGAGRSARRRTEISTLKRMEVQLAPVPRPDLSGCWSVRVIQVPAGVLLRLLEFRPQVRADVGEA